MSTLSASPPLEAAARPVGRRTVHLVDHAREGRRVTVDVWYPAQRSADVEPSHYEPIPGISFAAANAFEGVAMAPGRYPLIVLSHGRTGMRFAYAMLSEALAARGAVVIAPDHAGDVMTDWLGGTFVDDRTNEVNRVGDARFLLDALLGDPAAPGAEVDADLAPIVAAIDPERIAAVGHSYGAYTALAAAAGVRGAEPEHRFGAVVGLQPYTRSMSDAALARITTPTLLVLSEFDSTAPISTDGDRPWALIPGGPVWRLDLLGGAHHASSDMGLYLELAGRIPNLPPMVAAYVAMMTPDMIGRHLVPWRDGLAIQLEAIWAFLDQTLDIDVGRGEAEMARLATLPGVVLRRR